MIQNKVLYFKAECKIAGIIKMGLRGKVNFFELSCVTNCFDWVEYVEIYI